MKKYIDGPLVSIIVPVYNTEKYLEQCLESIINQTYRNLNVVLVDDGATDNSATICDKYVKKDRRVVCIHKENGGLSSARRAGIEHARGDYVMIVDSDDWIDLNVVKECVYTAEQNMVDCVLFPYIREYPERSLLVPLFEHEFSYDEEESEEYVHRRIIGPRETELTHPERVDSLSSVCMKLYRRETVRHGRIVSEKEVGTSEDAIFNLYALDGCRIGYIDSCFYHYRKDNANSITTRFKPDLSNQWDNLYNIFEEYISESCKKEGYRTAFLNRVACGLVGLGLNEVRADAGIFPKSHKIYTILKKPLYEEAIQHIDISYCPFKWKIFFVLGKYKQAFLLTLLLEIMEYLRSRI